MKFVLSLILLLCVFGQAFAGTFSPNSVYKLDWTVSGTSITFTLTYKGNGWAAVGFGADNKMPDTDIILCSVNFPGAKCTDRYATAKELPPIDNTQNVNIISATTSSGTQTFTFSRALNTGDTSQDFVIPNSSIFVLYAYGSGGFSNADDFDQHTTRGSTSVNLLAGASTPTPTTATRTPTATSASRTPTATSATRTPTAASKTPTATSASASKTSTATSATPVVTPTEICVTTQCAEAVRVRRVCEDIYDGVWSCDRTEKEGCCTDFTLPDVGPNGVLFTYFVNRDKWSERQALEERKQSHSSFCLQIPTTFLQATEVEVGGENKWQIDCILP